MERNMIKFSNIFPTTDTMLEDAKHTKEHTDTKQCTDAMYSTNV